MVCLGNICRSPLAEGILRQKITERNLEVEVHSSGTSNYHISESADSRMISTARRHGIDISNHKARQFVVNDFDYYDKIYVMDGQNFRNVSRLARNDEDRSKVQLIMNVVEPASHFEVPDPYYSGNDGFELVFKMLDEACEKIADNIETKKR
ncbi:MAG: low molecular weight phosphotyrosine protein phosphatase [Bacteroidales bacterium]|nr:low molecular weight phosphotyrosine protein phosphatase [Bacteroidales bacterium]